MDSEIQIPDEFIFTDIKQEDLSILIGTNGSGKSTLLNKLAKYYLNRGKRVIAVANSIHDKFDSRHNNFNALRGRSGRRLTRGVLKKALIATSSENNRNRLNQATKTLEYVGFHPSIGLSVTGLRLDRLNRLNDSGLTEKQVERIQYLLNKIEEENIRVSITWLRTEYMNFDDLEKSNLTELFIWESRLRNLKIIHRIEVFLKKDGKTISMFNASSGELSLITSFIYITTTITENTVLLIDEPENSLHPLWQKEYAKKLLDVFYLYQPKIIIATHSPLIVNGAELFSKNSKVFKSDNFTFKLQKVEPLNVEELYFKFFDVTTPENRFLSNRIARLLNLLVEKKITQSSFDSEIEKVKKMTYHEKQMNALSTVQSLALEIMSNNS